MLNFEFLILKGFLVSYLTKTLGFESKNLCLQLRSASHKGGEVTVQIS